jgi:hypothetical protein
MPMENELTARFAGLTYKQIIHAIETRPTVEVWPIAGPALGYQSKSASYEAARKGRIRVIEMGRKRPVPTSWLRHVLGLGARRSQRTSTVTDANVMAIRTGETIEALVRVLIATASLAPYFDVPSHVRELAEDTAKRIRREVPKYRAEGFGEEFVFGARNGGRA